MEVQHKGKTVRIERNQDNTNMVDLEFAITSRPCPPYCIQPMVLAAGVETIGELEVLSYLKRMSAGDDSILVIDSRDPEWLTKGMIPGAVSIPWTRLHTQHADPAARLPGHPAASVWCQSSGAALELQLCQDPGVLLQWHVVRPVAHQYSRRCSLWAIRRTSSSGTATACRAGCCSA
ncbi:MAG: rhodanese-like domain-containing protein [Chromatiales bacterium]|nr:rhodanese-like domain-containing protein [Chromatiales bacterium]